MLTSGGNAVPAEVRRGCGGPELPTARAQGGQDGRGGARPPLRRVGVWGTSPRHVPQALDVLLETDMTKLRVLCKLRVVCAAAGIEFCLAKSGCESRPRCEHIQLDVIPTWAWP